jgi:lysine 2,3-aminomutase
LPLVQRLRIHSRAPVHEPARVTRAIAAGLASAAGGKPLRLVTHPNHAVELTPSFGRAVATLREAGIDVLSQSVLLRGVNDGEGDLAALFTDLAALGVRPHYLHHPDRVRGAARFFVSIPRGLALYDAARRALPVEMLPAYVIDVPDGSGKIPVASLQRVNERRWRTPAGYEWDDVEESLTG